MSQATLGTEKRKCDACCSSHKDAQSAVAGHLHLQLVEIVEDWALGILVDYAIARAAGPAENCMPMIFEVPVNSIVRSVQSIQMRCATLSFSFLSLLMGAKFLSNLLQVFWWQPFEQILEHMIRTIANTNHQACVLNIACSKAPNWPHRHPDLRKKLVQQLENRLWPTLSRVVRMDGDPSAKEAR